MATSTTCKSQCDFCSIARWKTDRNTSFASERAASKSRLNVATLSRALPRWSLGSCKALLSPAPAECQRHQLSLTDVCRLVDRSQFWTFRGPFSNISRSLPSPASTRNFRKARCWSHAKCCHVVYWWAAVDVLFEPREWKSAYLFVIRCRNEWRHECDASSLRHWFVSYRSVTSCFTFVRSCVHAFKLRRSTQKTRCLVRTECYWLISVVHVTERIKIHIRSHWRYSYSITIQPLLTATYKHNRTVWSMDP